jgi:hypothetical protein
MTAQAYPLQWPHGRPRKSPSHRKAARFTVGSQRYNSAGERSYIARVEISVAEAVKRLIAEVDRIGGRGLVVSSNIELRNDGLPRSGQKAPADPGVCIYFDLAGKPRAMPCDTYDSVAGNIAAVAAHIEATRAIERHGVATVAEMFEGFAALPPPGAKRKWWEVFGLDGTKTYERDTIIARYRELAKRRHPDVGGSEAEMAELNAARAEALQ